MLKDRRVLLEQELKKAHEQAAEVYLGIVVGGSTVTSTEYQQLKDKISNLQFELNLVNQLIYKGHA